MNISRINLSVTREFSSQLPTSYQDGKHGTIEIGLWLPIEAVRASLHHLDHECQDSHVTRKIVLTTGLTRIDLILEQSDHRGAMQRGKSTTSLCDVHQMNNFNSCQSHYIPHPKGFIDMTLSSHSHSV